MLVTIDPERFLEEGRLLEELWNSLRSVPEQPGHPWRTPALATISEEGFPAVRTVVLRRVIPEEGVLISYTDLRSPKVAQLRRRTEAEWLMYDPQTQVQLRLAGKIEVVTKGADFEEGWSGTPALLRMNYRYPFAPGELLADSAGENFEECAVLGPDTGKENFGLLRGTIERMEWLQLRRDGHLRVKWEKSSTGWSAGRRIAP